MALDLSGYVAAEVGDAELAVAVTREAAELARVHDSPQRVSALAGHAAALAHAGLGAEAAAAAWEALELARASGSAQLAAEAAMTIGPVLAKADPSAFAPILASSIATYLALGAVTPLLTAGTTLVQMASDAGLDETITLAAALERRARRDLPEVGSATDVVEARLGPAAAARLRGHGASIDDDELGRLAARVADRIAGL
jgi:hypothetical protein